ncbi:Replicative DNA helicase [Luteitalea pratensis]|uniref:Replicative DNA helicase n=2 Tax=Luteitalea pratensis TaxID=1855912 RepID=A0A143PU12_LUTPR|nr:Replicative DNA helicase [Luteitalea pratensis]
MTARSENGPYRGFESPSPVNGDGLFFVYPTKRDDRSPQAVGCRPSSFMNERTLPHNLDAERSVLGAILLRNDAINAAVEVLQPEDFYRDAHQLLLEHMIQLSERGAAIDLVTLAESLTRADALEKVGGPAYITRLVDGVPRTTNIEHYAQIVKEKATLRRLITEASKIASDAYDADRDASEILDEAERSIFSIADARIGEGFTPLSELVDSALDTVEKLQQFKSLVTGVPTGFYDLDHKTSGMQPSDLVIIAARPSMGKTSFVINLAQNAALEHGKTVGVFSLEMSKEQLFMRMLTSEARVDSQRLRQGMLLERDLPAIAQAAEKLSMAKIFIDDSASIGVLEMRAKARRLKAEHGLDMLVIDYVQLMQGRGRFENRQQELTSISRSLKGLAKELHVPVLILSQLSRAPDARADHRPQLSDLRESGALEQDADVVMFIYREDRYKGPEDQDTGEAEIIISKQRNGPVGTVKLAFISDYTRFENLERGGGGDY